MKIIIAGDGKVGASLTRELSAAGYDITLIDANKDVLENTADRYDIMAIHGNCATMGVLEQAGVKKADLVIAATSADEINMLCCLTAHGMNKNVHTIARIRNPEYAKQIYKMRENFALSLSVNPEKQAALEIDHLLKFPGFLKRDTFAKGRIEIVKLRVDKDGKLDEIALSELNTVVGCKVLVCGVVRNNEMIVPGGNFVLKGGDRIFVTASSDNIVVLLKNLGIISHKVRRVLICGGSRISFYLAERLLRNHVAVQIIEKDYNKCVELAERLPDASIIHGDASNQELLESEGIRECDALVTMTGLDEQNIIISLYGNECKVPQVITKIGHLEQNAIIDNLPLGSVISPKELCCNVIERYVRAMHNQTGAALSVHSIAEGRGEAMEFRVDENTKYKDVPLKDIPLKKNILIVGISYGAMTEIPNGNSVYRAGGIVVVVSGRPEVIYQLNDIFAK